MKYKLCVIWLFMAISFSLWGQTIEEQGKDILNKSDLRQFPTIGSYEMQIGEIAGDKSKIQYTLQVYKDGRQKQTSVWVFPEVMKNNVGIRVGDTIYYKPLKATKPDIMSFQAVFLDSGFSWADVFAVDIAADYKAVKIDKVKDKDKDLFLLQLAPLSGNRYARIDVWIDQKTFDCKRRIYYSASGDKMKESLYTVVTEENSKVTSFKVGIQDFFMETKNYALFSKIKEVTVPKFFFDVQNIGRIHVQ